MEKTKRILLIASRPLSCDGLTKIEIDIINRFYKEIEFSVACAWDFDNEYGNKLKKLKLDLFKLPAKKNVFQYFAAIFKLVKRKKFDAVYVHGNSAMMIMEALPAKIAGCPQVITHCHNTKSNFPIVHYLAKPLFNYVVDVKIGCSSYAAKWAYFGKKVKVVNNGINVENKENTKYTVKWVGRTGNQVNSQGIMRSKSMCSSSSVINSGFFSSMESSTPL